MNSLAVPVVRLAPGNLLSLKKQNKVIDFKPWSITEAVSFME